MASGESKQQPAAYASASWKRSGFMKGLGIPTPSGSYEVGCVDVMLACVQEGATSPAEGDPDTILMRLFYPTDTSQASTDDYAKWFPHPKYVGAYSDSQGWKVSGVWSTMMKGLTTPRTPALYGAPLIGIPSKSKTQSKPDKPASKEDETAGKDEPPASGEAEKTGGNEAEQENLEVDAPTQAEESGTEPTPSSPGPFPVIIFSHEARHMRTAYSAICCDLASHGYVVASVEHRDQSACLSFRKVSLGTPQDGQQQRYRDEWVNYQARKSTTEQLQIRTKEVQKVLDLLEQLNEGKEVRNLIGGSFDLLQFKDQLRVDTAAIIGHSLGGATVVQSLFGDQRIKCGVGLDAWLSTTVQEQVFLQGVQQPLLFINSSNFLTLETIRLMKKLENVPDETTGISPCRILTIKETHHQSLSDIFFALPDLFISGSKPALDIQVAHSLIMELCHAFLKRYLLKGPTQQQPVPNLDGGEGASEYIIFGTNVQEPTAASASPTGNTSDQPGTVEGEGPAENQATPESKDEQPREQEEEGGESEKVEQHPSHIQEGSSESATENEPQPEPPQDNQPKDEAQSVDQPGNGDIPDQTTKSGNDDEDKAEEDQPQPEEDQPQPEEDSQDKEESAAEDKQPSGTEIEDQPSQEAKEKPEA